MNRIVKIISSSLCLSLISFTAYSMESGNIFHHPAVIKSLVGSGKKSKIEQRVDGFFTIQFKDVEDVDEKGTPFTRFDEQPYLESKIVLFSKEYAPDRISSESFQLLLRKLEKKKTAIVSLNLHEHPIFSGLGCTGTVTKCKCIPFLPLCLTVEHVHEGLNILKLWSLLSNSVIKEFRFDQSIKELAVKRCTDNIYLQLEQDSLSTLVGIDLINSDLLRALKWDSTEEQKKLYVQALDGSLSSVDASDTIETILKDCPEVMKKVITKGF